MAKKQKVKQKREGSTSATEENTKMASIAETGTDNISGYWKEKFQQYPHLLHQRSNVELYNMYLEEHQGEAEVPVNFKQGLSNVKSQLRGKQDKPMKRKSWPTPQGRRPVHERDDDANGSCRETSSRQRPIDGSPRRTNRRVPTHCQKHGIGIGRSDSPQSAK